MKSNIPNISVIMSVYNAEKFLQEAVYSILNQTYQDFEFIIINDGSFDRSAEILSRFAATDGRIRLITRENRGLTASLNEAILMAKGQWIARMDADDISHPKRFEIQLTRLMQQKADIAGSTLQFIGSPLRLKWWFPLEHETCFLRLIFKSPFGHPSIMMRASIARELLYDQTYSQSQDYELWTRFAMHGARMINCREPLLMYRRHLDQISKTHRHSQMASFKKAQKVFNGWLGIPSADQIVLERFSGKNTFASLNDAEALASILANFEKYPSWALSREYDNALLKVAPMHPKLIYKSIQFSKRVGADYQINFRLLLQSFLRTNPNGKIFRAISKLL